MIVAIDGTSYSIRACMLCARGRTVRNSAGKILGHYQPSFVYARAGVGYDTSSLCPGGARTYVGVVRPYRSAAILAAVRSIITA